MPGPAEGGYADAPKNERSQRIERLVASAAEGDGAAFSDLLDAMADMINTWVRRFSREFSIDTCHFEDVRQEVCLAIYVAVGSRNTKMSYTWEAYSFFAARSRVQCWARSSASDGFSQASTARRRAPRISTVRADLARRFGRTPSAKEVAVEFNRTRNSSGVTTTEEVGLVTSRRLSLQVPLDAVAPIDRRPLVANGESNAFMLRVLARCARESLDLGLAAEALLMHMRAGAPMVETTREVRDRLQCSEVEAEGLLAGVYASLVDELDERYAPVASWMRERRRAPLASSAEVAEALGCDLAEADRIIREIRQRAFEELSPAS